jgi:hypothetical protein
MPFGLNISGGDFLPIIKYDARAGRFFRVDRNDDGEREPVDITEGFECVPDFEHAEKGWAHFQPGTAPDFALVSVEAKDLPPQPSKNHKHVVRMRLLLPSKLAEGTERLREISVTAAAAIRGLEQIYDLWAAGRDNNPDKAAWVRLTSVKPVTSGGGGQKSTNYEPQFAIVKWVNSPEGFAAPERRTAAPNRSAAADDYKAAKDGSANPLAAPAKAPPPPENEENDWG